MAAIRATNTRPELLLRRVLHRSGLRYRLHQRALPGCPDLVFPKYRAAVFVHGCFFHGHKCSSFRWPVQNAEFWRTKITGNRARDVRALRKLSQAGWRTFIVWECAVRGPARHDPAHVARTLAKWLRSNAPRGTIAGAR
jgi:DNA mismatch endonuclease, patch repair protein